MTHHKGPPYPPGPPRGSRPVMIPQVTCKYDASAYVAAADSPAAHALAALPAVHRLHDEPDPGRPGITDNDRADLLPAAAQWAIEAGWIRHDDDRWTCPTHASDPDHEPRRFTIAECRQRLRDRS